MKDKNVKWVRKTPLSIEVIEFGKRIRQLMEQKEMKITELAYKSNLETENLRKYLNGRQEPKISIAIRIAQALEVEIGELFKTPSH